MSPSGHFVTYRGRTRMLIGDSGTQVVPMNGRLDLTAWLDRCRAEGHGTVHVWAFTGARAGDERLGRGPALCPWLRRTDGAWDLLRFDEGDDPGRHYWARMRALCRGARDRGLLLGVTVFFGWAKEGGPSPGWPTHPFHRANGGFADRSDAVLALAEAREIHAAPWSDAWPAPRKAQWLWERLSLRWIALAQEFGNVWFDYRDEWSYLNAAAAVAESHWRRFFVSRGCLWADRSGEGGLRVANPEVPAYGNTPAIKSEGAPYDHEGIRREVWTRALSGVHYLLHDDSREPGVACWDPDIARRRGQRPQDDPGRQSVGRCARFFNERVRSLDRLKPDPDRTDATARWMVGPEDQVAYAEAGTFSMAPAACDGWTARIYDPRTGALTPAQRRAVGGRVVFPAPNPGVDRVLWLTRARRLP